MAQRNYNNVTSLGTLSGPVAASATTFTVNTFTNNPAVPFTITVDRNTASEEICLVTAVAGSSLTVTRGFDGTAGQAHSAGATVEHTTGAIDFAEANSHVNATAAVHGVTGSLVGAQGAQNIYDKTLISPVAQADVTAGDAVVAYVPSTASVRNLFRGISPAGTDVTVITSAGALSTAGITSTTTLHAQGNTALDGTLTVTGTSTLTGAVTANSPVTAASTPTLPAHLVPKSYADGLGVSAATASTIARRDSNGRLAIVDGVAAGDAVTKGQLDTQLTTINTRTENYYNAGPGGGSVTTSQTVATTPCQLTLPAGTWDIDYRADFGLSLSGPRGFLLTVTTSAGTELLRSAFSTNATGSAESRTWSDFGQITLASSTTIQVRTSADGTGGTQVVGVQALRARRFN